MPIQTASLTKSKTPHRVGPPAREVFGAGVPTQLMAPLALVDGSVWGIKGNVPFVHCEYTDSKQRGLKFKRQKDGLIYLLDESKKRLSEWEEELKGMDIEVEVPKKPDFNGRYLKFEEASGKPPLEQLSQEVALLVSPKPVWLQRDQTPKSSGKPMRFLGQARSGEFSGDFPDFHVFLFTNGSDEFGMVWQNS